MLKKLIKFMFRTYRIRVNKITGEVRVDRLGGMVIPRVWCTERTFSSVKEAETWLKERREKGKIDKSWKTIHYEW